MEKHKPILIGEKLQKIRALRGLKQQDVAEKLNVTQTTYSKIERDGTDITISKLSKICEVFEIDLQYFFNFDETQVFNNCLPQNNFGNAASMNNKIVELYEELLRTKESELNNLKSVMR